MPAADYPNRFIDYFKQYTNDIISTFIKWKNDTFYYFYANKRRYFNLKNHAVRNIRWNQAVTNSGLQNHGYLDH